MAKGKSKKMSLAQKKAVSLRMKKYWAKRRKTGDTSLKRATPVIVQSANGHGPIRHNVRIYSLQDGNTVREVHEIKSWGELIDILHNKYMGIPIEEIAIWQTK